MIHCFDLNQDEKDAVRELRKYLLSLHHWPEMITFKEMNLDVPQPEFWPTAFSHALFSVVMEDGFKAGSEEILTWSKTQEARSGKETS